MLKQMEREIDDIDEADRWKYGEADDDETETPHRRSDVSG